MPTPSCFVCQSSLDRARVLGMSQFSWDRFGGSPPMLTSWSGEFTFKQVCTYGSLKESMLRQFDGGCCPSEATAAQSGTSCSQPSLASEAEARGIGGATLRMRQSTSPLRGDSWPRIVLTGRVPRVPMKGNQSDDGQGPQFTRELARRPQPSPEVHGVGVKRIAGRRKKMAAPGTCCYVPVPVFVRVPLGSEIHEPFSELVSASHGCPHKIGLSGAQLW